MIALLARLFAGQLFRTAEGEIRAGWEWIFATPVHLLAVISVAGWGFGFFEHRDAGKAWAALAKEKSAHAADAQVWKNVDHINHVSLELLIQSLNNQSGMVRSWAMVAINRQHAAAQALRDAQAASRALDTARGLIAAENASGCRTGQAILDVKVEF